MPIDLTAINWMSLGLLCGLAFVASFIGHSVAGKLSPLGAIATVIVFAAVYIFWNHYPHGLMPDIRFPK
ncbi:MAG: hypothetical protein ACREC6_13190 [Hyphomicrobiaceae bacterium]